jgi:hypothetical protein
VTISLEMKVRLANPPVGLVAKYTKKEREFFSDYATSALRLLSRPEVRTLLEKLINMEGIRSNNRIDLRVMMFPAKPLHGRPTNTLHGSYNHDSSQISLYPLKLSREWIRKIGYELFKIPVAELSDEARGLLREMQVSCLSTLVHEVLHVKFGDSAMSRYVEEAIVRKLEKKYIQAWKIELESILIPN